MPVKGKRGFANIVLILALVVLVGGVGYWAFTHKPSTPGAPAAPSEQTKEATQPTQTSPKPKAGTKALVSFTFPQSGNQVLVQSPTTIRWNPIASDVQTKFRGFVMALEIVDSGGAVIGRIGDGYALDATSATWDIKSHLDQKLYTLGAGKKYKIRANLGHYPPYLNAPPQLITEAKSYVNDSSTFTVDLSGSARQSASIDSGSLAASSGAVTITGVANLDTVKLDLWQVGGQAIALYVVVPVSNGKWSYVRTLPAGTYTITVWNAGGSAQLASGTLVVR